MTLVPAGEIGTAPRSANDRRAASKTPRLESYNPGMRAAESLREKGTSPAGYWAGYYETLRARVDGWLSRHAGPRFRNYRRVLFLVPDVFVLVFRLARDRRVSFLNRLRLWGLLLYILSPVDINLDFILPFGPLDDLALSLVVLNEVLESTPDYLLREHWPGEGDAIDVLKGLTRILRRLKAPPASP